MDTMGIDSRSTCAALALVSLFGCSAGNKLQSEYVEFGGCSTVLAGPVCVLDKDKSILLWLRPAANATVRFGTDGHRLEPRNATPVQGGTRYELRLPDNASLIELTIDHAGHSSGWRLDVQTETDPRWFSEASALFRAGNMDATRELLNEALTQPDLSRRADAIGLLGKLQFRAGQPQAARDSLRQAMNLSLDAGRSYDALRFAMVLVFSLQTDKQFTAARAVLGEFSEIANGHAESAYFLAYHRGLAASDSGYVREALRQLSQAADIAERFGWQRRQLNGEQVLAVQLQEIGRRDDARALLSAWIDRLPAELHDCEKGLYYTNVGWNELLRLEAGEQADDPLPSLQQASSLAENCSADQRANSEINLALAWLHAGDTDNAATHLEAARAATQKPALRLVLWALDIEARIAAARGDTKQARLLLEQLERLAEATLSPTARWRSAIGKALLAQQTGEIDMALAAFAAAEALLEKDLAKVPLAEGRESLVAARQWATKRHMQTLLSAGENIKAYRLARRTRQRLLYSLSPVEQINAHGPQARERWDAAIAEYQILRDEITAEVTERWAVPRDELRRIEALGVERQQRLERILDDALASFASDTGRVSLPRPVAGEVLVVFHALDPDWLVFIDDGTNVEVLRRTCELQRLAPSDRAVCLLGPAVTAISTAGRVVLLPTGAANDIDFHAMPLGNDVLLSRVAVVYSNDLATHSAPPPRAGTALVVADPLGDLPGARTEARRVQSILSADAGWTAELLTGKAAAANAVQRLLAQSTLFHYAGHATFRGHRGWDSQLRLSEGTALTITDILALKRPPTLVVLSGCETAAVAGGRLPQSVSLANAFLSSGSDVVIAATRAVPDRVTDALMRRFYDRWISGASLPEALRGAQLELQAADSTADWSAFRLIRR